MLGTLQSYTPDHYFFFFFFNDTATTEIYTLSLHDALPIGDPVDVLDVLVARDDQRRGPDATETLGRGRVEARHAHVRVALLQPERIALHLRDERSELRVDCVERAPRAGEPHPQVRVDRRVEIAAFERLVLGGAEGLHLLRPLVVVDPGADEYERGDALRRLGCDLERRPAAQGDADERGAVDAGRVHGLPDRARERDHVRLDRGAAIAWKVGSRHRVRLAERPDLGLPHARVRDPRVDQDDRGSFAVDVVPGGHASSANRGRTNSSNVSRSQLATVTGVSALTEAVRGMSIARATSPK